MPFIVSLYDNNSPLNTERPFLLKNEFAVDFTNPKLVDFVFTSYTLSAFTCFIISFCVGFLLMKYVVFVQSELKGRIQLFRYGLSAVITSTANWLLLKTLVELFYFYPSIANVFSTCIVVVISYLIQRNFTFK